MSKAWREFPSLREWKLHNFKSVADAELDLAPLTLVVGANSAGKSSLLQSILLMAQASAELTPGGFPLNGPLVGLGEFSDARSDFESRDDDTISIGGKLALNPSALNRRRFFVEPDLDLQVDLEDARERGRQTDTVTFSVSLSQDPQIKGAALVADSSVSLSRGPSLIGELEAFPRPDSETAPDILARFGGDYGERYKMTEVLDQRFAARAKSGSGPLAGITSRQEYGAVQFCAGVPINGLIEVDEVDWWLSRARSVVDFVSDEDADLARRSDQPEVYADAISAEDAAERLYAILLQPFSEFFTRRQSRLGPPLELETDAAIVCDRLMSRPDYNESVRPALLKKLGMKAPLRRQILVAVGPAARPSGMRFYAREVPEYFKTSVLYLGPLREDPRVAYPHSIAGSTHMPLGRKGESTASVLLQSQSSGRRTVTEPSARYPLPTGRFSSSLEDAVREWVREFGLGHTLRVRDEARYGVGFKIDRRDLTSVGTGVSQILPVIALCLMAKPGQLVLLEQPELHLNPALQQKLADFFLAIVRTGRQLLVETHSEYIVTRLRLRVVEDQRDQVRHLFNIIFAGQEDDGRTKFSVLDVDQSGALGVEEWPPGFFDQAGRDVEEMMRLALSRRRIRSVEKEH